MPAASGDSRATSGAGGQAGAPGRGGATQPGQRGGDTGSPAVPATGPAAPPGTGEQFAARESGATAGVVSEGGQPVFASSSASKGKKAAGSDAGTGSPSERSAVGDAWSGFSSGTSAGGSRATAASLGEDGSKSPLGMAILGLGLVGIIGTFLVLAAPRRRRAKVDSQGTGPRGRGPRVQ